MLFRSGPSRRSDRQDFGNKRRDDQPDHRYGSNQVAAVDQDQPGAGNSQRQRNDGPQWDQNRDSQRQGNDGKRSAEEEARYTFEKMWDGPCSYHTPNPRRPANHSTRQCSWNQRIIKEGSNGPARPRFPPRPQVPLSGANAEAVRAPQAMRPAGTWQENVNQVAGVAPNNHQTNNNRANNANINAGPSHRNEYREHHHSYMVFVTESTDKQSLHRRIGRASCRERV